MMIWAVGDSNDFGYHGNRKGSHTIHFESCPHGLVSPSESSVSSSGDTAAAGINVVRADNHIEYKPKLLLTSTSDAII